jgi:hypothetical protein
VAGGRAERVTDLYFLDSTGEGDPSEEGLIRYVSNDLVGYINGTVVSLTTGTGLSPGTHEVLDTLVHNLAEDGYEEVTRSGGQVTDVVVWTDSGKTIKIRELNLTRVSGQISVIVIKQYDETGTIITGQTLTGTVSRTGGNIDSITWVES